MLGNAILQPGVQEILTLNNAKVIVKFAVKVDECLHNQSFLACTFPSKTIALFHEVIPKYDSNPTKPGIEKPTFSKKKLKIKAKRKRVKIWLVP